MSDVNIQTLRRHTTAQRFPRILREFVLVFVNLKTIQITWPRREKGPRDLDVSAAIASQPGWRYDSVLEIL